MTYHDLPVIRSAGFEASSSGYTWSKRDQEGNLWIVSEDEATGSNKLLFSMVGGHSSRISREKFDELFGRS